MKKGKVEEEDRHCQTCICDKIPKTFPTPSVTKPLWYAYDPKIKFRVPFVLKNGKAISLVSGYTVSEKKFFSFERKKK